MTEFIKFKDEYFKLIIDGVKTQTMRMPQSRLNVKSGDLIMAVFPSKHDLLLKITRVGYKAFKSINDEDAKLEGFNNADELKETLKEIYKDYMILDSSRFYYYRFEYVGS